MKERFSFLDKETYEALPLTRWLDKSGHPIPGHPELLVEKAAEIKILSKEDPVPLDLLLRSNLVQQELSRMNINSLSLLDKTVQVTPQVVQIDHQKICMTDNGYNQVLVMIDHFTKYAEAVPCTTASAEETCDHLINTWIARHGCPMTFQSDKGTAFRLTPRHTTLRRMA